VRVISKDALRADMDVSAVLLLLSAWLTYLYPPVVIAVIGADGDSAQPGEAQL